MLKTGVKDGPTKGKSFYVCVEKRGCEFSQPTRSVIQFNSIQAHKYTTIELMRLSHQSSIQKKKTTPTYYRLNIAENLFWRLTWPARISSKLSLFRIERETIFFKYLRVIKRCRILLIYCIRDSYHPFYRKKYSLFSWLFSRHVTPNQLNKHVTYVTYLYNQ